MKQLSLFDFLRHLKRNIFVAFLLAILCLLVTSLYSIMKYEYGRFKPFLNLDTNSGFYIGSKDLASEGDVDYVALTEGIKNIENVERLYQVNSGSVPVSDRHISTYVYEEWVWKNWEGRLKSGKWFDDVDENSDVIQLILGGEIEGFDFEAGDKFICKDEFGQITYEIVGILQGGTAIPFSQEYSYVYLNYDSCYEVVDAPFFIIQKEAADKINMQYYEICTWLLVGYEEGLTEAEIEELNSRIGILVNGAGVTHNSFIDSSKEVLREKLIAYLPLMLTGIILVFVSLFVTAFINVSKGSRYYSIYYLVGANRRTCFWVACGNVVGTVALSAVFYLLLGEIIKIYTRRTNIVFSFASSAKYLAIVLYIVFGLFMTACMYLAMKKNSPMEILRKHG